MKLNDNKEIKPLFNYVTVREIDINPYIIRQSESGLILSGNGSMAFSQETGEIEKLEQIIRFGVIVETGDDCKVLKVGDEIYFNIRAAIPLPILDLGYLHLNEQNVMSFIRGEGDSIAEAREFEAHLREQLNQNSAKQKAEQLTKKAEKSLSSKGIEVVRYGNDGSRKIV